MPLDADTSVTDEDLLALYAGGDRVAARSLTARLTPRVLSLALRMLGDRAEAEDVAQEAMVRLWKIAPDWRAGEAKISTWLYRVAANLCTDRLRRRRGVGLEDAFGDGAEIADDEPRRRASPRLPHRRRRRGSGQRSDLGTVSGRPIVASACSGMRMVEPPMRRASRVPAAM